jgi:signal transduction histidine kinase
MKVVEDSFDISSVLSDKHETIQSVLKNLESKKYDTIIRNKYIDLSANSYNVKGSIIFHDICKIIERKSTVTKDTFGIIYAKSSIGLNYLNSFSVDSAYFYLTKAEKLSLKFKSNPFLGTVLLNKSNILCSQKDFSGAEVTAIKALKILQKKKYEDEIYSCYTIIANALVGMNKNEKALEYYNKALNKTNSAKDINYKLAVKASLYNYIALVFQKRRQHQKVIHYIDKNIAFDSLKRVDIKTYSYLLNTKSYSKFKLGDTSALDGFTEVLKIADSLHFAPTQIATKINLSEYYLAQKDTTTALFYASDAQKTANQNKIFEDELKALQLLASILPDKQSFYSQRYIKLNDSLQNIERATRDKFARIEYETEEVTKQKNIVEAEKSILLNRLFLLAGFGSLALIIIFLWFKNKSQKAKTRELLLEKENLKDKEEIYQLMINQNQKIVEGKQLEKKRISQELHDGVMGKLTAIRMNLYVLNRKTDPETIAKCLEYVKEIQNIENEIRIISHDLTKNLFSDNVNFVSIVENLFTAIKSHNEIEFSLKIDKKIAWETVDTTIKINIYRIIQEALNNIDKYSQASTVSITMEQEENTIVIEIKDDGIGFTVQSKKNGIGISNMQSRMQEIKGQFKIESEPKKGTKINLRIPN